MTIDPLADLRGIMERLRKAAADLGLKMDQASLVPVSPGQDVIQALFTLTTAAIPASTVQDDQAVVDDAFEQMMASQRQYEREEKRQAAAQRMTEVDDLLGDD